MDRNRNSMTTIFLVWVFFISGCALHTSYGKIRPQPRHGERVTIQELQKNWEDYTIHYAGLSVAAVAGIMFDPKNDNRTLTGNRWTKVEDQETLAELIGWMKAYTGYYPEVLEIRGPDNDLYGYLFYPGYQSFSPHPPVVKVVNDTTMYMYDLESPIYWINGPYFYPTP